MDTTSVKRNTRRRKKRRQAPVLLIGVLCALVIAAGFVAYVIRYAPTKETMPLSSYFHTTAEGQAAVIVDGAYDDNQDGTEVQGLITGDGAYLEIGYLDSTFDKGYFYDTTEGILRYVTDTQVISAAKDNSAYGTVRTWASRSSSMQTGSTSSRWISSNNIPTCPTRLFPTPTAS